MNLDDGHRCFRDGRLEALAGWISLQPLLPTEPIRVTALFERLQQLEVQRPLPFRTPLCLATWLGRCKEVIEAHLGVRVTPTRSARNRFWTFQTLRCHDVRRDGIVTVDMPANDTMAHQEAWLDAID